MITYNGLPISSGGAHSIRNKDLKSAWDNCNQFISSISHKLVEDTYTLDVYVGCKGIRKYLWKLFLQLGIPSKIDFASAKDLYIRWCITPKSVPKVIDFLISMETLPEYWLGPIHFYREGQFLLKDPVTGNELPDQNFHNKFEDENGRGDKTSISNFRINFTSKVSISTWLVLPFEELNKAFYEYIDFMTKTAPFSFSDKQWRKWKYSKGKKLYASKIDINLTNHRSPIKNPRAAF